MRRPAFRCLIVALSLSLLATASGRSAYAQERSAREEAIEEEDDDDKKKPSEAVREDELLLRLKSNRHLRIRARSVKLRKSAYDRIREIAKRYHAATKRKLVITGGDRTPRRQAELMYRKLEKGDNLLKLYTQVRLVMPLMKAYAAGKAEEHSRRKILRAMTKLITEQVAQGRFVSRHLAYTAADVRSRGLKGKQVQALQEAVKSVAGARLVDERSTEAPHFHLSL